ncbi:Retrovirus-related Pol polyprotein from transposon 412 family [Gossypium australe]|uniref:Retrovirus-related Pol polyprotein from transposon 412 family n=1 Tax=Gossypium australe TaxID=47621 RepID=A0A5B6VKU4_9ROSI|nr:Retrovirus-related Pol polyprotein from transposon 412 family [Gossypium australe]
MAIFSDMVEKFLEVFMDDFSVFGDTFESCLKNLKLVLYRCEETNLVLNWEKYHFMVYESIVLGHKISHFLGHARFYRRFSKDLLKISKPLCTLLEHNRTINFDEICLKAFEELKSK